MSNVKTWVKKLNDFIAIFGLEQEKQGDFISKDELANFTGEPASEIFTNFDD